MKNGIILINKDKDWTSHDVVAKMRSLFQLKKVGHTGTLDPMAQGLLPICLGQATRLADYIARDRKTYIAEAFIGYSTTTYDSTGQITATSDRKISLGQLEKILEKYTGEIQQVPPMYSAIKVKGKKLYEYARKGIEVERKPRLVKIYSLKVSDYKQDSFQLAIECSSGTYIRSLIHDLGHDLGSLATMTRLLRTSVGNFKLEEAYKIAEIEAMSLEERKGALIPGDRAVDFLPKLNLSKLHGSYALNGRRVPLEQIGELSLYRVYSKDTFIGLGETRIESGRMYLQMRKVFK